MAALTESRVLQNGRFLRPEGIKRKLTANSTVYGGSLAGVRDSDGELEPATSGGSYNAIVFIPEKIDAGEDGIALSDVVVLMNTQAAFDGADLGNTAYVEDDNTVRDNQAASEPTVGNIVEVQNSGNEAFVHVPGLVY